MEIAKKIIKLGVAFVMNNVECFINDMKKRFPVEMETVFYQGYCYWFAVILAERFNGEIWFNPIIVHFATKIGDFLYDIYGRVEMGLNPYTDTYNFEQDWCSWEDFQINHHDVVDDIIKSCIKKVGD